MSFNIETYTFKAVCKGCGFQYEKSVDNEGEEAALNNFFTVLTLTHPSDCPRGNGTKKEHYFVERIK